MRTTFIISALAFVVPALSAPTVIPITKRAGLFKPGSYIVKLKDGASNDDVWSKLVEGLRPSGSSITYDYRSLMPTLAVDIKDGGLAVLQHMSEIEYIEQDWIASINYHLEDAGFDHPTLAVKHSEALVSRADNPGGKGKEVNIYGIDTGIYKEHACFGGRAVYGATFPEGAAPGDENGHGTHTAAKAVGKGYGAATDARIVEVKVLDGNGSGAYSDIIAGVNWAVNHFKSQRVPAIATMSLGGPASAALDEAVKSAMNTGLHFTVAAGNDNMPAGLYSPARVPGANTIGAVDSNNRKASFSNYGSVLDVWALGVDVLSAWNKGPDSTAVLSGTSMATPLVAGILAVAISVHGNKTPDALSKDLKSHAVHKVTGVLGTPILPSDLLARQW